MKAAVVDMTAADATKLLLHYWAAVCTKRGGAYQLRRFALAKAFRIASPPHWQLERVLSRGMLRRRFGTIDVGLLSFG
jgi:hypothetical protein